MQYLAEVEKKTGGLLGGGKTSLRLLACQKSAEEGWKILSGDNNVVYTDKVGDRGPGALVMAELSGNEVRRVQGAARDILGVFKTYAALQGKLKEKDDDIDQWKESLTYQSQELSRRLAEVELREEKVQQMDEEVSRLEQQRREVEAMREEAQRLRLELEDQQRSLDQSLQALQGEQHKQPGAALNADQLRALEANLGQLESSLGIADALQERVQHLVGQVQTQQSTLDQFWPLAQVDGGGLGDLPEQLSSLQSHWQSWHEGQTALALLKAEENSLRRELENRRQHSEVLQRQIKAQSLLQTQIVHLAGGLDPEIAQQIDYETLENQPLEELESKVSDLQKDYERTFNFVNDQEDELRLQLQTIEAVKARMAEASEFDRLTLSTELADEQDSYRILDESMVDQRRTLHERKTILEQYQAVLARRQGRAGGEDSAPHAIDMAPVLAQLEADAAQHKQQLDGVAREIHDLEAKIRELEAQIESKTSAQQAVKAELDRFDHSFRSGLASGGNGGAADAYQSVLNPVQEMVNGLRQQFQEMQGELERLRSLEGAVTGLRQSVNALTQGAPHDSASHHANPFSDAA